MWPAISLLARLSPAKHRYPLQKLPQPIWHPILLSSSWSEWREIYKWKWPFGVFGFVTSVYGLAVYGLGSLRRTTHWILIRQNRRANIRQLHERSHVSSILMINEAKAVKKAVFFFTWDQLTSSWIHAIIDCELLFKCRLVCCILESEVCGLAHVDPFTFFCFIPSNIQVFTSRLL